MGMDMMLDDKNLLAMKLLHYFITEKNYNLIVLQGVENEIWLENLNEDCKVIRIVSGYIHNKEQFDFDKFKTKRILSKIKKKTLSFKVNVLSIFLDLGENISDEELENKENLYYVKIKDEKDVDKSDLLTRVFPDIDKKIHHAEKGEELFMKITGEISKHNHDDARKVEKVFKMKFPMFTYILIAINLIFYVVPMLFGSLDYVQNVMCTHGPSIRAGQFYRLLTGMFVHGGFWHVALNCYSLYIIGSQMESYLGKLKFIIIYLLSGLGGALFSITFMGNIASVGASGAIFGLLGSMLYFGYHYRVYLGNVIKSQILPLIAINLIIGFTTPGIDNAAHIGGLITGALVTMAVGIDNKSTKQEMINGCILTAIVFGFMIYMAFVYVPGLY